MSIKEAGQRRDFTFNALAKDPLTGEIFDPYGGVDDLRFRTLRVTDSELFKDDPLRIMRAGQFVGRFGLRIEPASMELMRGMVPTLRELSKERFQEEWNKLLTKSERPSLGLQALYDIGVIDELYPELAAIQQVPQEFEWHPEGDVWVHTLMVVDAARDVCRDYRLSGAEAQAVMYAALCHDLGKALTTKESDGRIRSRGHEPAGEDPTRRFLFKIGASKEFTAKVVALVTEHLWPGTTYRQHLKKVPVTDGAFRKLAKRLAPATIAELTYVAESDNRGRGPFTDPSHKDQFLLPNPYEAGAWVRAKAIELGVEKEVPPPLLQGRDLLALGFVPGPLFRELLRAADVLRDEYAFSRAQVLEYLASFSHAEDAHAATTALMERLAKEFTV